MLRQLLLVSAAGAVGTALRFLFGLGAVRFFANPQLGTFAVNVIGSFAMGYVASLPLSPLLRLTLLTGLLGGFTTYSAFNEETLMQLRSGRTAAAAAYVLVTVAVCLAAGAVGAWASRVVRS